MRVSDVKLIVYGMTFFLISCSPSSDNSPQSNPISLSTGMVDATEAELLNQGWRPGTMKISVMIEQGGALREASASGGGTATAMEWSFRLQAQRLLNVLVAPDLAPLMPATESADELLAAFHRSPVYLKKLISQPAPEGQARYSKQLSIDSPGSATYSHLQETMRGEGDILALKIAGLRPSYYGRGYEFELKLTYRMLMSSTKIAQPVSGATTHVEEELPIEESLILHLFPSPDLDVLESYPFAPGSGGGASPRQAALGTFRALNDAAAGVTLVSNLRPGLQWTGEKDRLTLAYSLSGNSQPPLFGDITGLATRIEPNRVEVRVVIEAL